MESSLHMSAQGTPFSLHHFSMAWLPFVSRDKDMTKETLKDKKEADGVKEVFKPKPPTDPI
jgi:hypothetical protein